MHQSTAESTTADIPPEVENAVRKFRFKKASKNSALVVRILSKELRMEVEETYDDVDLRELADELPENSPRYVALSYELEHSDGRTSYPLLLINWVPTSCETRWLTLHASALNNFTRVLEPQRVIEVRDGADGLSKEIIDALLKK